MHASYNRVRLRAVSLCSKIREKERNEEHKTTLSVRASNAKLRAVSTAGVGRRPTPALLVARGLATRRSYVTLAVTLARSLDLRSPPRILQQKRDYFASS